MNHLRAIVLVTVSIANAVSAQERSLINPASVYHQGGVTVVSPNQPGWVLLQSSKSETVFQKRDEDEIVDANVKTFKTKIFDNDKDRLINWEILKQEELSKLKRDSIHFNYVRFKGSRCVQYDGIFKVDGAAASKFEYLNLKGYLCPQPESKDLVVQIEFSNHSHLRGFSENLLSLSDEFFEKIVFSKSGQLASESPAVIAAVAPATYPAIARQAGARGKVIVEVQLDAEGSVLSAKVISGHLLLQNVSEEAAKQWKFSAVQTSIKERAVRLTFAYRDVDKGSNPRNQFTTVFLPPFKVEIQAHSRIIN